jgi:hypothetical protein
MRRSSPAFGAAVLSIFLGCQVLAPARAFDTGHHQDMTRSALEREGFGDSSIRVVQLQNWLTDLYGAHPLTTLPIVREATAVVDPSLFAVRKELEKLHFDNLFGTDSVRSYWLRLLYGARLSMRHAAEKQDILGALTILGVSLHAVQDFYSHSNWIAQYPLPLVGPIKPRTWFDVENHEGVTKSIMTGLYPAERDLPPPRVRTFLTHAELNKDSYQRQGWEDAYILAYTATREWVRDMRREVEAARPGFWNCLQTYRLDEAGARELAADMDAARDLSLSAEGHWKGPGTADAALAATLYRVWSEKKNSRFVDEFRQRPTLAILSTVLSSGLDERGVEVSAQVPRVVPFALDESAITLHTTAVHLTGAVDTAAFDALVTMSEAARSQSFEETNQAVLKDRWTWQTVFFTARNAAEIRVHYVLVREPQGLVELRGQQVDIHPAPGKLDLDFTFSPLPPVCRGDVTQCSLLAPAEISGDGVLAPGARVRFHLLARPVR